MANPKIYYANVGNYTLSASGGAVTGHPLTDLQDFLRSSYWQSDSQADNQYLTVDFGVATSVNYVILDTHNFDDLGGALLTIEGADDSGMTTNKVQAYQGNVSAGTQYLIEFQGGVTTKRYWRFTYALGSALPDSPAIGNLFMGQYLEFSFPYEFGAKLSDSLFESSVGRSLSGVQRASQAVGGKRAFELSFRLVSDATAAAFRTFHDTVRGRLRPFYFSPDGGTTLHYVHLTKDYNPISMYRYGQNNIETLSMETADAEVE